jgi:hypothetical protein
MPVSPSLELKWPRHDADHSPPSSVEVTSDYISNTLYAFMAYFTMSKLVLSFVKKCFGPTVDYNMVFRFSDQVHLRTSAKFTSQCTIALLN